MKIRYFSDTALIEFSDAPAVETKEITENLFVDLDENRNLNNHDYLSMQIRISFLQMEKELT